MKVSGVVVGGRGWRAGQLRDVRAGGRGGRVGATGPLSGLTAFFEVRVLLLNVDNITVIYMCNRRRTRVEGRRLIKMQLVVG